MEDKIDIFDSHDATGNVKSTKESYNSQGTRVESFGKNPAQTNIVSKFISPVQISDGQIGGTITSSNYKKGVSGWAIYKNGDVEFNVGNFRGNLILTQGGVERLSIKTDSGLQFYDSNGVLSGSIFGSIKGSISIAPTKGDIQTFRDIVMSGANAIYPTIDNSTDIGTYSLGFKDGWFSSTLFSKNFYTQVSSTGGWSGDCVPDYAGNRNLGSSSKPWGNLYTQGTTVIHKNLPTSATGLPAGSLWNSSGVVHVV